MIIMKFESMNYIHNGIKRSLFYRKRDGSVVKST